MHVVRGIKFPSLHLEPSHVLEHTHIEFILNSMADVGREYFRNAREQKVCFVWGFRNSSRDHDSSILWLVGAPNVGWRSYTIAQFCKKEEDWFKLSDDIMKLCYIRICRKENKKISHSIKIFSYVSSSCLTVLSQYRATLDKQCANLWISSWVVILIALSL